MKLFSRTPFWMILPLMVLGVFAVQANAQSVCPLREHIPCLHQQGFHWVHMHVHNRRACCGDLPEEYCRTIISGTESRLIKRNLYCFEFSDQNNNAWRVLVKDYTGNKQSIIVEDLFCKETVLSKQ